MRKLVGSDYYLEPYTYEVTITTVLDWTVFGSVLRVSIFANPGGHPSLMPSTLELTWNIVGSTITITGIPGVGELTGTLGDGGFFFAIGDGAYAGYSTSFRIDGIITPDGISGTLNIGSDGGLPGGELRAGRFPQCKESYPDRQLLHHRGRPGPGHSRQTRHPRSDSGHRRNVSTRPPYP